MRRPPREAFERWFSPGTRVTFPRMSQRSSDPIGHHTLEGGVFTGSPAELANRLRSAEARFDGIVGIAADAVISVDERQLITLWNAGATRIFGYSAAEALGRPLAMLLPQRFHRVHEHHVREFASAGEHARQMGHRREISGVRKNGEEFPAEASISRYREESGELVFNVVLRDISERKRAEERLRLLAETGEILGSSLDAAATVRRAVRMALPALGDCCIVLTLSDGLLTRAEVAHVDAAAEQRVIALMNGIPISLAGGHPAAAAIRERAAVSVSARSDDARLPDAHDAAFQEAWSEIGATSALFAPLAAGDRVFGALGLFAAGREFESEDRMLATELARRIGLALENARLYEESQRAIRARDETVAVVSHDLRNPVNAISMIAGNIGALAGSEDTAPAIAEYMQVIQQAAAQADALIQDLLDVTRIEAGRLRIDPATEALDAVVNSALLVLAPLAHERSVALEWQLPDDLPPAFVDAPRLQQVVSNVVGNAIKFTPPGGRIDVRLRQEGDTLVISVADTGPGISVAQLPHIFDRYWQGSRSARFGAGLGLPIAKGIVEAHGGDMWVDSTAGKGSTFHIRVPMRAPAGA